MPTEKEAYRLMRARTIMYTKTKSLSFQRWPDRRIDGMQEKSIKEDGRQLTIMFDNGHNASAQSVLARHMLEESEPKSMQKSLRSSPASLLPYTPGPQVTAQVDTLTTADAMMKFVDGLTCTLGWLLCADPSVLHVKNLIRFVLDQWVENFLDCIYYI